MSAPHRIVTIKPTQHQLNKLLAAVRRASTADARVRDLATREALVAILAMDAADGHDELTILLGLASALLYDRPTARRWMTDAIHGDDPHIE